MYGRWFMLSVAIAFGAAAPCLGGPTVTAPAKPSDEALIQAVNRRDVAKVRTLLDAGADPNAKRGQWGGEKAHWLETALIEAARLGELPIANLLLERGADPTLCVPLSGFGPMDAALRSYEAGSADVVRRLMQAGVSLTAQPPATDVPMSDWHGRLRESVIKERLRTRLHQVVAPGRDAARHDPTAAARKVRMLIDAGMPLDVQNSQGQSPLLLAVAEGRFQGREAQLNVIRELLRHRPNLDLADRRGRTALHHAVIQMDAEVIALLLKAGARTDIKDSDGLTPPDLAQTTYPRAAVLKALGLPVPTREEGIHPHITPSRTEGVAPLAVFFDGIATDGLTDDDYVNAYYEWNFDTTGVDAEHPRRKAIGFNVAHVFMKPGTYTVAMTVRDVTGKQASKTLQVVVREFAGRTIYLAADGNDANPGTAAAPRRDLREAILDAKPNTRILLRRGDTFDVPEAIQIKEHAGPVLLGAYSGKSSEKLPAPVVRIRHFASLGKVKDWRFMDLHFVGQTTERRAKNSGQVFSLRDTENLLLLRLEIENVGANGLTSYAKDGLYIVDCHMHDFGAYSAFVAETERVGYIGNRLQRMHSFEHGYRSQSARKQYIAHNTMGKDLGNVKSAIQIRGNTSQTVLADNRLAVVSSFNPANTGVLSRVHHCLADRNILTSGLTMGGQHIAFRRNRLDYQPIEQKPGEPSHGGVYPHLVSFGGHMRWPGVCEKAFIYDNTVRSGAFLSGPVHDLDVHGNRVALTIPRLRPDRFAGFVHVGSAARNLTSRGNRYQVIDRATGKIGDVSAWLKAQQAAGLERGTVLEGISSPSACPTSRD